MSTYKVRIRRVPLDWIEQAPSAVIKRRMYDCWEACQIALAKLPPDGADEHWARRHKYAAWSYASLLKEGVPKEPSLDEASANITKHYVQVAPEVQQAWPFMDLIKVESDYTIASHIPDAAFDLADLHLLLESLRQTDEISEALTRLNEIFIEIKKTEVARAIVRGILESRQKYGEQKFHRIYCSV